MAEAVVREHLSFGRLGYYGAVFGTRDDLLQLYDIFCETEREILWVLLGLNRLYPSTPSLKYADELITEMRLAPPDFSRRLKEVFRLPPADGVAVLNGLCEEVFALVETHLPGVETTEPRSWLTHHRAAWDQPPQM
ncbi:MAG TPA: hypothetical protein VF221_08975 [Chloroflexota bacterium]